MSQNKPKVRKTLRIQENIEHRDSFIQDENRKQQDDLEKSFESEGFNNHLRCLYEGRITGNKIPQANHVVVDTMKIETDANEFSIYEQKENLDEWYQHTKSKLVNEQDANIININEIKDRNQQKILMDVMKHKYKSPNLDHHILDSILNPEQNNNNDKKENTMNAGNVQQERKSFSHISNRNIEINYGKRDSIASSQIINRSKKASMINVNAVNTQGNICTSLTLLQQYNSAKQYQNPEIVKKNNIQKIVHNIIQDKMEKVMKNPKQYFEKYQGIKNTNDLGDSVHTQTLKNFKNLRKYFKYGQKIDYDSLLNKLLANKSLPHKLFNFTEDEINPASSFKDVEPELLNRYQSINKAIEEKKQQQRLFRIEVAGWVEELNDSQIELSFVQNRYEDLVQQHNSLDKQIKRTNAIQKSSIHRTKSFAKSKILIEAPDQTTGELSKLNEQHFDMEKEKEKLMKKKAELETVINSLNSDIHIIIQHIEQCDRDVEKLKISRINLKTYLRDNYTKMLKKDLSSLPAAQRENISLVWVIKSMIILNDTINRGSFPQFLDEQSITFLKQAAILEQELDQLKHSLRNHDFTKIDVSQSKKDKYEKVIVNLNKDNTKNEIQKKLKSITSENLQVKKPIFSMSKDTKKHEMQWISDNLNPNNQNTLNKNGVDEEDIQIAVQERQRMVEQMQQKQNQYSKLKDHEMIRLIQQHEKREDQYLLKKFVQLFGTIDGATEHHNYIHMTQCFMKKLQESKNFTFTNNNRSYKIKNNNNTLKSTDRLQTTSSQEIKSEPDNISSSQIKLTPSRQNFIASQSMVNMTDKYINTIKGPLYQSQVQKNQSNVNNYQLDAFDTFMGLKVKPQTPSASRVSTTYNALSTSTRSTFFQTNQSNFARNLSINF